MANFTPQQIEEFLQEFFDVVGTRQYIGARYVPLFGRRGEQSIAWDNTAPYEPLTIVTHQGNSYTSRTYVPTGIDIANQDYWVLTGAYNAQVEAYRQEVIQLQTDWGEWKSDTEGDLDTWKTDTESDLDTWKTDTVENFEQAIGNLPNIIPSSAFDATNTVKKRYDGFGLNQYANRKCLCVSDSWGVEGSNGVTTTWMHLVCNALHMEFISLSVGGTGYLYPAENNFKVRLQNYVNSHTTAELAEISYVILCGSSNDSRAINDYANLDELYRAILNNMYDCYDIIRTNMQNAFVFIVPQIASPKMNNCSGSATIPFSVWGLSASTAYASYWLYGYHYNMKIFNTAPYWLFGANNGNNYDTLMNADNVHPKQAGHNKIAEYFLESLHNDWRLTLLNRDVSTNYAFSIIESTDPYGASETLTPLPDNPIFFDFDIREESLKIKGQFKINSNAFKNSAFAHPVIAIGVKNFIIANTVPITRGGMFPTGRGGCAGRCCAVETGSNYTAHGLTFTLCDEQHLQTYVDSNDHFSNIICLVFTTLNSSDLTSNTVITVLFDVDVSIKYPLAFPTL